MMKKTYDQYKYRSQCFDDEANWIEQGIYTQNTTGSSDSYCSDTKYLINDRLYCYESIEHTSMKDGCFKLRSEGSSKFVYEHHKGVYIAGYNINEYKKRNITIQECANLCDDLPECKAYE